MDVVNLHPNVTLIERVGGEGISSAIRYALPYCHGDFIAIMDADLQHSPEVLTGMFKIIQGGETDLIVGTIERNSLSALGIIRKFISSGATWLAHLMLPETREITDPMSGFFMFREGVVGKEHIGSNTFKVLLEVLVNAQPKRISEYPFTFGKRNGGFSKFGFKEMRHYIDLLLILSDYRVFKFITVGLTGVLVNEIALYVLHGLTGILALSSVLSVEASILTNFALNNTWTFSKMKSTSLIKRLFSYNAVALGGLIVNTVVLLTLAFYGIPYLIANLLGITLGFTVNYFASESFVWKGTQIKGVMGTKE
jgi:dolichol-phosphate mannosyltransferase